MGNLSSKKHLSAGQRWGRWHWIRVVGLRCFYFPFWRSVNGVRRGLTAMRGRVNLVTDNELVELTTPLDSHPDDWHHPCNCADCRSYGDA